MKAVHEGGLNKYLKIARNKVAELRPALLHTPKLAAV